ncbi:MAG: lytic transglycosylase domain-containing protein [Deltaproteobacteria bacterium]|nr:MAG: lytic transglycosylase domain-containing protein [Deltaproteobacteria bacterium]
MIAKNRNSKKLLDISVRLLIIGFLLFKAMSHEYRGDELDKIAEVQKIVTSLKSAKVPVGNKDLSKLGDLSSLDHSYNRYTSKASEPYHDIILRVAKRYNVDPALIKAVIKVESHFNPYAISYKGAKGLMQLMPVTLRAMGARNPFDPEYNIDAGVRYLKKLLIIFDDNLELALAAYNAGITKVRLYGGIPPFKSTRKYVRKVMQYYNHYKKEMSRDGANDRDA